MADPTRFGKSERAYTGIIPRHRQTNRQRFGRSERAYTGVTDRTGGKYDRFGPSEKRYSEARYTPSGKGTSWGFTGDSRRKIPGYDAGSRPPRGLASLISREGIMGQDPRSSTYSAPWNLYQTSPDDLRGYRASVADAAAANAEEERERIAIQTAGEFLPAPTIPYQYRGRYETPGEIGKGYGMLREDSPFAKANVGRTSIGERESGDVDWGGLGDDLRNSPTGFSGQTGEYNYGKLNKGLMNTGNLPAEMMMAELTPKQQEWMRSRAATPDFISPDYSYKHVQGMENKPWDFQWGEQEPTTREEFDEYYNYLLANPSLTSWQT